MKKLAEVDVDAEHSATRPSNALIQKIADFLDNNLADTDYDECTDQLLRFCKKMSQQSQLQKGLFDAGMHGIALRHIQVRNNSQSVAASLDA